MHRAVAHGVVLVSAAADDPIEDQGYPSSILQPTGTGPDINADTGVIQARGQRETTITLLTPGEFFGELAALDWGSGFGYPRLATVAAASDARLLRVPCDVLNELVRSNFELERAIDRVARERIRIIAK